jgi:hypothetical protein
LAGFHSHSGAIPIVLLHSLEKTFLTELELATSVPHNIGCKMVFQTHCRLPSSHLLQPTSRRSLRFRALSRQPFNLSENELSELSLVGRVLWVEPDKERSAISFSPRKAIIVRVIGKFPVKDAVFVELAPPALVWDPLARRLTHVLLRYRYDDDDSIQRTFRVGLSVADVYRPKRKVVFTENIPRKQDISRLGIATVKPWPTLSPAELRQRLAANRQHNPTSP